MKSFMVLGMMAAMCFGVAWALMNAGYVEAAAVAGLFMLIFTVVGLASFAETQSRWMADVFRQRREALAVTPESVLFELARTMHPETTAQLLLYRKIVWRVREARADELCEWVLDADPRVTVHFVEYVLQNSNPFTIMPKNRFAEGTYSFDAAKITDDRTMYEAFYQLLLGRHMITEYSNQSAGAWIEPWNPETAARRFGTEVHLNG